MASTATTPAKPLFSLPALSTWQKGLALESARKLLALQPSVLAVGHGRVLTNPAAEMERAEEDAIHAIRSLRSIVHGFISLEVAGGFAMPVDLDASFNWLINLFIAGLDRPM